MGFCILCGTPVSLTNIFFPTSELQQPLYIYGSQNDVDQAGQRHHASIRVPKRTPRRRCCC
jgi:hypothetical protein